MPSLEELNVELDKTTKTLLDRLKKLEQTNKYKEIGYAPRCKVCNNEDVDKIESLYEDGYSYSDIILKLDLDLSEMSLSRHFNNHYPKRTRYKLKRKKLMLETVIDAINMYPFLEDYFMDKDYNEIKCFTEINGFCTDCFKICQYIPANTVLSSEDLQTVYTNKLHKKLNKYSYREPTKEDMKLITIKEDCLSCKNKVITKRLEILERLIANLVFNTDINNNELFYLLTAKYDNNIELFYKDLINKFKDNTKETGNS